MTYTQESQRIQDTRNNANVMIQTSSTLNPNLIHFDDGNDRHEAIFDILLPKLSAELQHTSDLKCIKITRDYLGLFEEKNSLSLKSIFQELSIVQSPFFP